jgi:NADH-quinone oxidoreductase subunit C
VPDATELELTAQELRDAHAESVRYTEFQRDRAVLVVDPTQVRPVLEHLRGKGYTFLASLHGVDYYPQEPRLGVLYEMLDMQRVDRISVKARVSTEDPHIASVVDLFPTANAQEREVYDMFGVVFEGHPGLTRILMPDDWEGFPQRKDYPLGGVPVEYKGAEIPPPDQRRSYQ